MARQGAPPPGPGLFHRRDVIAVAVIAACIAGSVAGIALLSGGGDGAGTVSDRTAIEALARRSIEVLPAGQWPTLYDDFTVEFQQRCPRQEFIDGGAANATELGASLPLLAYKRLEQFSVNGDSASAVVVGEIKGESEYSVQAAFQRVNGAWKLTAAPGTDGCAAFTRLESSPVVSPAISP
jgi:hypothetical protein